MAGFSLSLKKASAPPNAASSASSGSSGSSFAAPAASASSVSALFQASLDAEEEEAKAAEKKGVMQSVRLASGPDRRHQVQQQKALAEDSTVFAYDEVFERVSSAVTKERAKKTPRIYLGYKTGLEELRDAEQGQTEPLSNDGHSAGCEGDEAEALPEPEAGLSSTRTRPSGDKSFATYGANLNCGLNLASQRGVEGALSARERREKASGLGEERETPSLPASRFISKLVVSARRRALEREIAEERQLQKERAGDKNDEVFVTSAYKQRLEERRLLALELEEQERRDRENAPDKQSDLSSFHAHLLRSGHASRSGGGERTPNIGRATPPRGRGSEDGVAAQGVGEHVKQEVKRERTDDRGDPEGQGLRDAGVRGVCVGETEPEREADLGEKKRRLLQGSAATEEETSSGSRGRGMEETAGGGPERREGQDGSRAAETEEDEKQSRARLEDLLQQKKREKQRKLEQAAAPLGEDKLSEAKRRYLERKRKAAGGG
ncbi:hypothetical protein TGVAND_316490 [Toxoplasma gondii VAND]|uniref:Nuclear speckle splicing regulatory protein 1 N-terminal domain-containing protein n=1 Tax=Toxoplasma gondii VAND TaxID=933077 RepID=A0A086PNJ5_TOXGO|nr:hypothetical protein TGVAND_316490 [Toxoplasma gondii VAND]